MGQLQPWSQVPRDPAIGDATYQFLTWVQAALNQLIGNSVPLPAPINVGTKSLPAAVYVTWDEVPGASVYQVFESVDGAMPTQPLTAVPAQPGGTVNGYTRSGLATGATNYYAVRALAINGTPGAVSLFRKGSAA